MSTFPPADVCAYANTTARFLPQTSEDTLPCIELTGVQVYAYLDPEIGAFRVSVDLDTAAPALYRADSTIPVRVDVAGSTVFDDSDQARAAAAPSRRTLLREFIATHYQGDATTALLDLADVGQIAVNYLDRAWFAGHLGEYYGMTLTDEGWAEVAAELGRYDEHVCNYAFPNVQNEFAEVVLRDAGVLGDAKEDEEGDQDCEDEPTR